MAQITAALVKELREKSGAGMMDCKKALSENDGDIEAATDWLRAKGLSKAAKKSGRVAADGLVGIATSDNGAGMTGAVLELNAETDFVARNEIFQKAVRDFTTLAMETGSDIDALKAKPAPEGDGTVEDMITRLIATIGENMTLRRAASIAADPGIVAGYVHSAEGDGIGKIGVLVALESSGDKAVLSDAARKIAMHIAATSPLAATVEDLDPADIERERAVLTEQARESGKPDNVIEKMIEGRMRKFYEEVVLEKQAFVMDPDKKVGDVVTEAGKAAGGDAKLLGFVRFTLGEGIEKEETDFAAEVAEATKG